MAASTVNLKEIIICPSCLSDQLVFNDQIIHCLSCQNKFDRPKNQAPHLVVNSRPNQLNSHQSREVTDIVLDVGAGMNQSGSLNIDIRPVDGIDVVCNALYLPFRSHTFSKVIHNQVLEHFRYQDSLVLLKEIYRVLKPGGTLEFWTPNFQAVGMFITWLRAPICLYYPKTPTIYPPLSGVQDYPENVHMSQWNRKLVAIYAKTAGFHIVMNKTEQEYDSRHQLIKLIMWAMPNRRGQIHFVGKKPR